MGASNGAEAASHPCSLRLREAFGGDHENVSHLAGTFSAVACSKRRRVAGRSPFFRSPAWQSLPVAGLPPATLPVSVLSTPAFLSAASGDVTTEISRRLAADSIDDCGLCDR